MGKYKRLFLDPLCINSIVLQLVFLDSGTCFYSPFVPIIGKLSASVKLATSHLAAPIGNISSRLRKVNESSTQTISYRFAHRFIVYISHICFVWTRIWKAKSGYAFVAVFLKVYHIFNEAFAQQVIKLNVFFSSSRVRQDEVHKITNRLEKVAD